MLLPTFRLCYAEAPFPSQAGTDVGSVYADFKPFKAWLRWLPDEPDRDAHTAVEQIELSLRQAMADDDLKGATGEWVALLGFSQGAKMCASLLFAQQIRKGEPGTNRPWPRFRFAVLLAGRGPLVSLTPELPMPRGLVDASTISTLSHEQNLRSTDHILQIPTIHVHGMHDPGLILHRELLEQYCGRTSARLVQWDGEHRVPIKTKDATAVVSEILSMARDTGVLSA
ncbi:hypothetical protein V502_05308 [Pseudogymnoascus sp. VKM F-4520 (FW-2644)]|nr:hypothetical protein V502_05308 [Pseudogymnoascus sp. VKM F-4520 (FW-2644)]